MTLLYSDPLFLSHDPGCFDTGPYSLERPDRLRFISDRLGQTGLLGRCKVGTYQPLSEETIAKVHAPAQIRAIKQVAESGGGHVDRDTAVGSESFIVALAAAGACSAAVEAVLKGAGQNALCLVRPPGHHAGPTRSTGFCLFNNIALAAQHAKDAFGLTRLLIVDWDVHHGDGTQEIFYDDPEVAYLSVHRYGDGFYPGTGAADETGRGQGLGFTFNVPVRFGTSRRDYHSQFTSALEKAADTVKPELVLVSAGFDAHARDPLGSLDLETEDFMAMTRQVLDVAQTHARGQLVSCLEGGYNLDALAESVQAHLQELLAVQCG